MTNALKSRLAAGDQLYGCWLAFGDAGVAELLSHSGFDFLILDNEHGPGSIENAVDVMRACDAAGCPLVIRVPSNDPVYLKRILDAGAISLMIPMIEDEREAKEAVAACRYPPFGARGYAAGSQRCTRWSVNPNYLAQWNDELLIIGQIESANAASHAAEIASTGGIDVVLIGINDLGGSLGHLENGLSHPDVADAALRAENGIKQAGKPLASVPSALHTTPELFARGYQMVAGSVDSLLLMSAARREVDSARMGMSAK